MPETAMDSRGMNGDGWQRLGRNHGRYHGETIDVARVMADCLAAARQQGWLTESLPGPVDPPLWAFHRRPDRPVRRVYVSAGIHGDEPAGPLAARRLLQEDRWPADAEVWLLPCLNPTGFVANTRENRQGLDLNREYHGPQSQEVAAHIAWLERQPGFDLTLCLHEDWESHGFYLYELNPDGQPSLAPAMVAAAGRVCPIDLSPEIEGRPAQGGIIHPSVDPASRPQWPEAFYLLQHKTRLSYTLEAPSDFPLSVRVAALVAAVQAALG